MKALFASLRQKLPADYRVQLLLLLVLVSLIMGIWYAWHWREESTDNATVQCDMADVVAEVSGVIASIDFKDDQFVKQGAPLVKLEDSLYRAQAEKAEAALRVAQLNQRSAQNNAGRATVEIGSDLDKLSASFAGAQAQSAATDAAWEEARQELAAAEADLQFVQKNHNRDQELLAKKALAQKEFENSRRDYQVKLAALQAAQAKITRLQNLRTLEQNNVRNADLNLKTLRQLKANKLATAQADASAAQERSRLSQVEYRLAGLNLEKTLVRAKIAGTVTNRRLSAGEYIDVGQRIATVVACHEKPWVIANFKETQIAKMKPGQKARIQIDTYPGVVLDGIVEGISTGTGSTFSVLPPENATGNFTKVVKRMPVKITILDPRGVILRTGASSYVTVRLD
jgi:membrane fusion protein (multidrug efflux system)